MQRTVNLLIGKEDKLAINVVYYSVRIFIAITTNMLNQD